MKTENIKLKLIQNISETYYNIYIITKITLPQIRFYVESLLKHIQKVWCFRRKEFHSKETFQMIHYLWNI